MRKKVGCIFIVANAKFPYTLRLGLKKRWSFKALKYVVIFDNKKAMLCAAPAYANIYLSITHICVIENRFFFALFCLNYDDFNLNRNTTLCTNHHRRRRHCRRRRRCSHLILPSSRHCRHRAMCCVLSKAFLFRSFVVERSICKLIFVLVYSLYTVKYCTQYHTYCTYRHKYIHIHSHSYTHAYVQKTYIQHIYIKRWLIPTQDYMNVLHVYK